MTEPGAAGARMTPTVVVARRVRDGSEAAFETWAGRLLDAAGRAEGYLAAELERPGAAHPDEWVVVYRFADAGRLEAWLRSPARTELLAEGAALIDGVPREQIVALPAESPGITAVATVRIRPGHEAAFAALHAELTDRLASAEGFRRSELYEPVPGVQEDTVIVFTFEDRARLDAWLGSAERAEVLERMAPHVEGERTVNVIGGFAGWFDAGPAGRDGSGAPPVRRWKQATTVLLALFPTTLGVTAIRQTVAPDLAMVPAVFVGNVVGVAILTWVLMPPLTRALDPWLRR